MRKLGLIGGMSWLSTRTYYEHINKLVQARAGQRASAPLLIESLDFSELYGLSSASDWDRAASVLGASARRLADAGARTRPAAGDGRADPATPPPQPPRTAR